MAKVFEPLLDIETILPILGKISIFGGLTDKELFILFRVLEKAHYKTNDIVFSQGEVTKYLFIIKKGRVRLFHNDGTNILELMEFQQGQCFGETSLIGIIPQSASVIAIEDTELIVLSGKTLYQLYQTDLELYAKIILNIARESCRRLAKTDEILFHYISKEQS